MSKYQYIVSYIKDLMENKHLTSGDKLPSVRQLSKKMNCSISTVIRAYKDLEDNHFIYSVRKSGYYVVGKLENRNSRLETYDFLSASPDTNLIPYKDFQHCMNAAIELYKNEIFSYSSIEGLNTLRSEIKKYLRDFQIFTEINNIVVTNGAQQAINMLIAMDFPNQRHNILIESPTYHGVIEAINTHKSNAFSIDITRKIDINKLENIFRNHNIKLFLVTTRFHNPTGQSYSESEKKAVIELLNKYDVYLIEDDYLGELDFDTKSDPFYSYDNYGRVIYIKSFSKIFLPGLRLGCAVLPQNMVEHFKRMKFSYDVNSSTFSQGALDIYMKNGMFTQHMSKLRILYKEKIDLMKKACERYFDETIYYTNPKNGFFITIFLPSYLDSSYITNILLEKNIHVKDCKDMYLSNVESENAIRLSSSKIESDRIENGIKQIATIVNSHIRSNTFTNSIHSKYTL